MRNSYHRRRPFIWCVIAALVGAGIAISLFGRPSYKVGGVEVRLSIAPSLRGVTRISLPPLGSVSAVTHIAPVALRATVDEANVEEMHSMLVGRSGGKALIGRVKEETFKAGLRFAVRLLLLSFFGGAVGVYVSRASRSLGRIVLAGLVTALMMAGLLGLTAATYNTKAFRHPTLTNTLRNAPWIIRLVEDGAINIGQLDNHVRTATSDISRLEGAIGKMAPSGMDLSGTSRILAISDIHNNPIALGYVHDLAKLYDVDLILNAGDLTDLGSRFESTLVKQAAGFERPVVFVAGNHDSRKVISSMAALGDVYLPDERVITVDGFRILGQHDPGAKSHDMGELDVSSRELSDASRRLRSALRGSGEKPDILIVHEPAIALRFMGKVPIIVSGHDHTLAVGMRDGTAWIRPGSTGASGVRFFTEHGGKAMTAVVLYVTPRPHVRVVAADLIEITSPSGEFTITRKKL